MRIFSAVFWAIFLLLSGGALLLRQVWNRSFRVLAVMVGIFIFLMGISLMTTPPSMEPDGAGSEVYMDTGAVVLRNDATVTFGQVTVDLTEAEPGETYHIECAFGQAKVLLPADAPLNVKVSVAFGQVEEENGSVSFGEYTMQWDGEGEPVYVAVECSFGYVSLCRA